MALSSNTVWEVRSVSSDTNGGGFVSGASGTDFSQQDAKNTVGNNISTTDAAANGTTTITSATAAFTAAIVGNIIYLAGGSGSIAAGWYQVTAFTNATTITIDRTIAASTGMTLNIGGALASPGTAASVRVSGNTTYVKAGTYTISSTTANVSGGIISDAAGGLGVTWEGYQTARGDLGTAPVFQVAATGVTSVTIFTQTGTSTPGSIIRNIVVDGQGKTSIQGFNQARRAIFYACTAKNCTNIGFTTNAGALCIRCVATNITGGTAAFNVSGAIKCEAYGNTVTGFAMPFGSCSFTRCLSYNNTGASSDGFDISQESSAVHCVAYGNGRDGFRFVNGECGACYDCLAEANSGYGFNASFTDSGSHLFNCGAYNNTSGAVSTNVAGPNVGFITNTTGSFFVNAAATNFGLNSTANQGALARGVSDSFPVAATTSYEDVGAAESQATGGGGGMLVHPGMSGGMRG